MKIISVVLLSSLLSASVEAQDTLMIDNLRAVEVHSCNFWIAGSGGNGFVCANMPPTSLVAEARSFAAEIRSLREVIADLEKRIEVLEKK